MEIVGKVVKNKAGSTGTITRIEGTGEFARVFVYIDGKELKYQYPSAFECGSLVFTEEADISKMLAITSKYKEEKEAERQRQQIQVVEELRQKQFLAACEKVGKKTTSAQKPVQKYNSVQDFADAYSSALRKEIYYLKESGGKKYRLFDGIHIISDSALHLYLFEADVEHHFPDGTQIILYHNGEKISGSIISCEEYSITIGLVSFIGKNISSIEFTAEPWQLLNALLTRLTECAAEPSQIVRDLIMSGKSRIQHSNTICRGQAAAKSRALSENITFIWGPPGTGKTHTLADIAIEHIQLGHKVLMVSYSNVSVDAAVLKVNELRKNLRPGEIVRFGYPRNKELIQNKYLTSYSLALKNHPTLLEKRTNLLTEKARTSRNSVRYIEIDKCLGEIRDTLLTEEKQIVTQARFLATTVSKALLDKTVYERKFDVVLFDEASMAYIPQILIAASLAKSHFCCFGDFCQLPPIVQSDKSSILNNDIFAFVGISDAVEERCGHEWLVMLDTQRRMHPQISDFVSFNMYKNLIKSADGMENMRNILCQRGPFRGSALGLIDLSGMMSVCSKTSDQSHIDLLSALFTIGFALSYQGVAQVGIVTPYSAQARLIQNMLRDIDGTETWITSATVHQFQGSERDVIIYDAVDCYREDHPGMLLTSMDNNNANRLFNVAITRSQSKFLAVTNVAYMYNKNTSEKLLFTQLLKSLKNKGQTLRGEPVTEYIVGSQSANANPSFFLSEQSVKHYFSDLASAKKEIRIDIPGTTTSDEAYIGRLVDVFQTAISRGVKVYVRAEKKNALPEALIPFAEEKSFAWNPLTVIDKEIIWFGQPFSEANFISLGSEIITSYRPVIRFFGKHSARSVINLYNMDNAVNINISNTTIGNLSPGAFRQYLSENMRCEKCGKAMILKKSKSGYFAACSGYPACESAKKIPLEFINHYLLEKKRNIRCPNDNTSLEAKNGQYGVYIKCCANSGHTFTLDDV